MLRNGGVAPRRKATGLAVAAALLGAVCTIANPQVAQAAPDRQARKEVAVTTVTVAGQVIMGSGAGDYRAPLKSRPIKKAKR